MANVTVRLGYKDSAWFTANPSFVLSAGQHVYLSDTANRGQFKLGDGVTQLSALSFIGSSSGLSGSITTNTIPIGSGSNTLSDSIITQSGTTITVAGALRVSNLTPANRVITVGAFGELQASSITTTQLGYLSGVTSNIQSQLNGKLSSTLTAAHIYVGDFVNSAQQVLMSGDATMNDTGALTLVNASVTGQPLTGFVSGAGVVTSADSILSGFQKLDGNINALVTGVSSVNGGTGVVTITTTGTVNRISVTGGSGLTPTIDISASYVGQSSITTLGTITTGTWNGTSIGAVYGGTDQTTVTTGDLLYGSAANTWSKLAGVATGNALISGGVSTAPSWGKIGLTTHISGTLPVANGGTNSTAALNNNRIIVSSGGAMVEHSAQTSTRLSYYDANGLPTGNTNMTFDGTSLTLGGTTAAKSGVIFNLRGLQTISAALGGSFLAWVDSGTNAYRVLQNLATTTADWQIFRATGSAGSESFSETMRITNSAGDVGIGTGSTVSARIHAIKTTEQLRVGYDASNYYSTTVSSAGAVTFNAVGASSSFIFNDSLRANLEFNLSQQTNANITANQDNYAIGNKSSFRLPSDASRNITGLTGGVDGKLITIFNVGSNNIVFQHQNASSTAANRMLFSTGADITVAANGSITIQYDNTTQRWRDVAVR